MSFYDNSENAVNNQLWIANSVNVWCAIIKIKLQPKLSLNTVMQLLRLNLFKRHSLNQIFTDTEYTSEMVGIPIQLNLFDKTLGH